MTQELWGFPTQTNTHPHRGALGEKFNKAQQMRRGNFAFIPFARPRSHSLWAAEERRIMATARQRSLGASALGDGSVFGHEQGRGLGSGGLVAQSLLCFRIPFFPSSSGSGSGFGSVSVSAAAVFVFWDLANLLTNYEYYSFGNEVRKLWQPRSSGRWASCGPRFCVWDSFKNVSDAGTTGSGVLRQHPKLVRNY